MRKTKYYFFCSVFIVSFDFGLQINQHLPNIFLCSSIRRFKFIACEKKSILHYKKTHQPNKRRKTHSISWSVWAIKMKQRHSHIKTTDIYTNSYDPEHYKKTDKNNNNNNKTRERQTVLCVEIHWHRCYCRHCCVICFSFCFFFIAWYARYFWLFTFKC